MAHQHSLDDFRPERVFENVEAHPVYEATGTMRLKVSKKVWKELNIPDKGDFKAVVRGVVFMSRYDVTAGLRLRIPSYRAYLFRENGFEEENSGGNGANNGHKPLFIDLWVEDGILCMSYKPDEEYDHYENKPSFKTPNYGKGIGFCPICPAGYLLEYFTKCPFHGIKLRTKPRKKKNKQCRIKVTIKTLTGVTRLICRPNRM